MTRDCGILKPIGRITFVLLAALLTACNQNGAGLPSVDVTNIQAGAYIPWAELSGETDLSDADSHRWLEIPAFRLNLSPAPPVHASVQLRQPSSTASLPLHLQVASDDSKLYLRLVWQDESHNAEDAWNNFADSAAVQFVLGDVAQTTHMMGAAGFPVNIWYWNAARQPAQSLAAEGFGNTTRLPHQNVTADATYDNQRSEWQVVFARSLDMDEEHAVLLRESNEIHIAFAIWQGASGQRDGDKRTSMGWITFGRSSDRFAVAAE